MPITRNRFLRPRKKIGLESVAAATSATAVLARCRTRDLPYRPAGPTRRQRSGSPPTRNGGGCTTDRVVLQDSSTIAWPTPVSTLPRRTRTPDIIASRAHLGRARRRSALRDERASHTTSGRRPLGTTCERQPARDRS